MYKVNEVSKLTNIPISTLHYYEELNLLNPQRNENNYRVYSDYDIEWINFIKRIKETGMSLKEIQHYSDLRNQGDLTIVSRLELLEIQELKLLKEIKVLQKDVQFIKDKKNTYEKMLFDIENK